MKVIMLSDSDLECIEDCDHRLMGIRMRVHKGLEKVDDIV